MPIAIGANAYKNAQATQLAAAKVKTPASALDSIKKEVVPGIRQIANGVVQTTTGTLGALINTRA